MARLVVDDGPPVAVVPGQTLLEACEAHGVELPTDCGGFAACASCRVRVCEGADLLSPLDPLEDAFLDTSDQRLGCQARVVADGTVRVVREPG
ncbi:MAG: (2Fe-2S)-binding protein [Alphaproteobacteria bacterium]|nr:(2Fe-2S)-binding protein [Alphaproteobacteria bacterium]